MHNGPAKWWSAYCCFSMEKSCWGPHHQNRGIYWIDLLHLRKDFLQETGPVGRDWQHSCAVLMYHGQQLRNVDQDVKDFLKSTECRRLQLLKPFLSDEDLRTVQRTGSWQHACCDICKYVHANYVLWQLWKKQFKICLLFKTSQTVENARHFVRKSRCSKFIM